MGSLYFDKKFFISKLFRVKSSESESFEAESLLPMSLSILYTKSLTRSLLILTLMPPSFNFVCDL